MPIAEVMPYALLAGLGPAAYHAWRNRSRLARRLTVIMLLEVILASMLILLPFWALNTSYEEAFEESFDDLATTSTSLSNKLIILEHDLLDSLAGEALGLLSVAGSEPELALFVDEFREKHGLEKVALLDRVGRVRHISPAASSLDDAGPLTFFMVGVGESPRVYRDVLDSDPSAIGLVRAEPYRRPGDSGEMWLLLMLILPESVSHDITMVEESGTAYHKSRSQRQGLIKTFNLIIINSMALLLFVAINLSVYVGTRLGLRLGNLSERLASIAASPNPGTGVPVEGDDEITSATKAFNEMVERVNISTTGMKQALQDLEDVQNAIDSGLLLLDGNNRITRHNPAAESLLGVDAVGKGESLDALVARKPELAGLAKMLGAAGKQRGGETRVGERKLWVRLATMGDSKIVLLTDISEPMALEEIRSRQEAMSYTLHGIKNPLQPLLYHVESLDKLLSSLDGKDAEFLKSRREAMLHNISRINDQIEDMGRLVRKSDLPHSPLDINALVSEFVRHSESSATKIFLELGANLAPAKFNKHEFLEVLENLHTNAEQQFDLAQVKERKTKITTSMEEGQVLLVFEDNAGGIDEDRIHDIFRPHMSNKPKGQGLGLARVRAAIKDAGGSVDATNIVEEGEKGARFTVRLPAMPAGGISYK